MFVPIYLIKAEEKRGAIMLPAEIFVSRDKCAYLQMHPTLSSHRGRASSISDVSAGFFLHFLFRARHRTFQAFFVGFFRVFYFGHGIKRFRRFCGFFPLLKFHTLFT